MLIQLPILFALYRVIYNVPAYVEPVREIYEHIAQPTMSASLTALHPVLLTT